MASSKQSAKDYVTNARQNLIVHLYNHALIVDKLHQLGVFNVYEVSAIEAKPNKHNKTRNILDWVINHGEEACQQFLKILYHERKSVFPKTDLSSQEFDFHNWISLFSFRDEPEETYIQGPSSCRQLQIFLKRRTKSFQKQCKENLNTFGVKGVQDNFKCIPLVLDTDTKKNSLPNKITLKSKKSKKPRSKKIRAFIPQDTDKKSPEDLLNSKEKNILLVGKPGIGKTTTLQQMLFHWAERSDGQLDFLFYFDENTLPCILATTRLKNLLLEQFLMSNPKLRDNVEEILDYLQEYSDRVTLIFDGIKDLDENSILRKIMNRELMPDAKIVATCRPEAEDDFSDWLTCKVYVQGFSEESIHDYLTQIPNQNPDLLDNVVNNPALFSLCHVPMYAFMVAACFSHNASEGVNKQCTVSELYLRIIRHCAQRHGNKKLRQLSSYITACRDSVLVLAEHAFNATKVKTINFEFDYDKDNIASIFIRSLSDRSPGFSRTFCAFLHNTMQEFFSALWLLENPQKHEILQLCQTKESKHLKHVIPFLCGLHSETNTPLLKCIFPTNRRKEMIHVFFENFLNNFLPDQSEGENTDIAFICQCLFELQSPEACCSFLERTDYYLDLSSEHLDPHTCCAVSFVIGQSNNKQVQLDLANSVVAFSGLKKLFEHSRTLRNWSTTLCQLWTAALKYEEPSYLFNVLILCENEIHLPVFSQLSAIQQAGNIITNGGERKHIIIHLHLNCDRDSTHHTDVFCKAVSMWLPYISSLNFVPKHGESSDDCEKRWRPFKLDLCLQAALHQTEPIQTTVKKIFPHLQNYGKVDFLLDLYSHMKQYENKTGRNILQALLPVYQSAPEVWSINLSERKSSVLLEVLKLTPEKKIVELRGCSDEESEVKSLTQCLPFISKLRISGNTTKFVQFMVNLSITASDCQSVEGENFSELLTSVCSYKSFPLGDKHYSKNDQSDFLLDLYSHMKQYENKTGRNILQALLPVYQSAPEVWSINLSERKSSVLLEVLKLTPEKKIVELIDWSDEESEVKSLTQCLPFISKLRCAAELIPHLTKLVIKNAAETEFVKSLLEMLDFTLTVDEIILSHQCRALGRVLRLSASRLNLTLNPKAISLKGVRLLFRNTKHLPKLMLNDSVIRRMTQAFREVKSGDVPVIEELSLVFNNLWSQKKLSRVMSSLSLFMNVCTVHCLNLTENKIEAKTLTSLMCHPRLKTIRLSKESLQQFADLVYQVQDTVLGHFFLKKVGGDMSSCSFGWTKLLYFLQQRVCHITVNMRNSKITDEQIRQLLPLLSEVCLKRINSSVVLSIIREIYESRSAYCVSSLLRSAENCINLNSRELDHHHCSALRFILQNCTAVSLSLLWTSIPDVELEKILPLFRRVVQLSVDRFMLVRLIHCCRINERQQEAVALLNALQNKLDFSSSIGLDLTEDKPLHLTTVQCEDIISAILNTNKLTELVLEDCGIEDTGVNMLFSILHNVRLRCSKAVLLQFLSLVSIENEQECGKRALELTRALDGQMDLSETQLDLQTCKSLAFLLELSEGLSELDLSHCELTAESLEPLLTHLHKIVVLDLSHNKIDDLLAKIIYKEVSTSSNIQTVRLFSNRITDKKIFQEDKRFEIW